MNKLKMQSPDGIASNIEKIARLFPNCVTEHLDKAGKPELAIDFEKLQAELSNDMIAEGEERYQFTWPNKRAANRLANTPTTMTLRPCREESVDFDHTKNLYIEGDNLEILKVLRETYLGKVKMMYIDPPYNTGNDFVYNDDFAQGKDEFEQQSGLFDNEGNQTIDRMQRNTESNGRFHTDWLNMMYPRLKVARDLLTEDGVIFISIDDGEVDNLKKICNEIFGEDNFLECLIWKKRATPPNDRNIGRIHEFILTYTKNIKSVQLGLLPRDEASVARYSNPDNDSRGPWVASDLSANGKGGRIAQSCVYPVTNPANGEQYWPTEGGCWRFNKEKMEAWIKEGRIAFRENTGAPYLKRYLSEVRQGLTLPTIMTEFGFSQTSAAEVDRLFQKKGVFEYAKPTTLINPLIRVGASSKDALILDFFSGSATTADAIMQLNAEDGGNRRFIMVQLPESCSEKTEAYKSGYKNVCEIGKERIRRAGKKIKEESGAAGQNLDIGFRVLKLDTSNMEDVYYTPRDFNLQTLFNENVKPDRSNEDLLFQVMLDLGVELSAKIEARQIAGKTVHFVDDHYLVACFDSDVNDSAIKEIAKLHPVYFVMRDSSAASDNVIDNFEQIFKHYSPDTTCKII